jgi:arabinofuranan 3-O-arabinosyltransferase
MPDELVLRDSLGETTFPVQQASTQEVVRRSGSRWHVTATLPPGPQLLVLGQNYDPRWTASIDGRRLGRPVVADGYSAAWVVNAPGTHVFDVWFAPQRYATAALVVSSLSLLLSLGLVLRRERRVARAAPRPAEIRTRWRPRTELLGWSVVVTLAWLGGGLVVGTTALALALWHGMRPPRPRQLLAGAVTLLLLTPAAFIVGNMPRWGSTSANLVWHNQWPHWLAGCALLLLCVGVWREDRHVDRRRQGGS